MALIDNRDKPLHVKHAKILSNPHDPKWDYYSEFKRWAIESGYKCSDELEPGYYCALFRKDTSKPYSPEVCFWKTMFHMKRWMKETYYTHGETLTLFDWCEKLNKDYFYVGSKIIKEHISYGKALGLEESADIKATEF